MGGGLTGDGTTTLKEKTNARVTTLRGIRETTFAVEKQ
jgi:hypothetical protein